MVIFYREKESALERGKERGESAAKVELAQVSLSSLGLIEFSTCENSFPHFAPFWICKAIGRDRNRFPCRPQTTTLVVDPPAETQRALTYRALSAPRIVLARLIGKKNKLLHFWGSIFRRNYLIGAFWTPTHWFLTG